MQNVHGLAALALAVPVFFHWNMQSEDEDRMPAWASTGLDWRGRIQLVAFCIFEVSRSLPLQATNMSQPTCAATIDLGSQFCCCWPGAVRVSWDVREQHWRAAASIWQLHID